MWKRMPMNRNNAVYMVSTAMFRNGPKKVSPPSAYLANSMVCVKGESIDPA